MSSSSLPHSSQSSSTDRMATFVFSSSSSQPPSSSALNPSPILTPEPSPTFYPSTLTVVPGSSSSTSTQSLHFSTSSTISFPRTPSSSLSPPSPLNPTPTGSTKQNGMFTTSTQSISKTTGLPGGSTTQGFFGNTGAVVGTFTVVGVAIAAGLLVAFLCRRRYRRNKQRQTRIRDIPTPQPQMHENPFADDPFARHNPHDLDATIEDQREVDSTMDKNGLEHMGSGFAGLGLTNRGADAGSDTLDRAKQMGLAEVHPGFSVNCPDQGLADPLERRVYRPTSQSPPYDRGPTAANRRLAISQSKTYFPFPNRRRISQTPSSPSMDLASLSVADDDSAYRMSTPMSIACPGSTAIPNPGYNPSANAERRSSYRVPPEPETYTIPFDSQGDQGTSGLLLQEPPSVGDRRPVPPPIPPKSPFRTAIPMQPMYTNVHESEMG